MKLKILLILTFVILSFLITNKVLSKANAVHIINPPSQVATTTIKLKPTSPKVQRKAVVVSYPHKEEIIATINRISTEMGYPTPIIAIEIARGESRFNPNAVGDGHLTCKKTGKPIRSRGVYQINNCAHPNITDAQAFDIEWSTRWSINQLKMGNCRIWTMCPIKSV